MTRGADYGAMTTLLSDAAPEVITQYAPMRAVLSLVDRVAATDAPVLIIGPSGSGKNLLARVIHRLSGRAGPFVEVDGAGMGGVGTARLERLLELASCGTLYVESLARMSMRLQARLVTAMSDVRFIAAAARDVDDELRDGRIHSDMAAHLGTVKIELPPLAERAVDIPLLAEHFLSQLAGPFGPVLTPEAVAALEEHSWPGNVRELATVLERAVLLARGHPEIRARDLVLPGA